MLLGGVVAISALSWLYILRMAWNPVHSHGAGGVPAFAVAFAMWTVMMIAMMLPAASPFVLAFAAVQRKRNNDQVYGPVSIFLTGYFFIWTVFSGLAALIQQALRGAALLSPALTSTSAIFAGGLLVAAGVYQWTPLKNACLRHCRSALGFVLAEWREGASGAFLMGVEHGIFCLGCCWALMALPFAAGVMNLFWMAAITVFILIEKAAPAGEWVGRVAGGALIVWGGWMITAAIR
jgi:predicted metal-binding membrane protein